MKSFNSFLLAIGLFVALAGFSQGNDCSNATVLSNVNNFCSAGAIYTNVGSNASGFAVASCWSATATEDVWFSFTATGTDVLISVSGSGFGGTMGRPRIALYAGSCATTINQLGCNNGAVGSGITQLYVGGLALAQTYYIRVSSTGAQEGTFELCVNNYVPPASASADCGGAGKLCNKNGLSVGSLSGGGSNQNEPEATSCMVGDFFTDAETNSVWYTWTCGTSGTLTFDITPLNSSNDIDYVLWQLNTTNPCGARTVIRCNTSSCLNATGSTGLNTTDTDVSEDPGCEAGENSYCQQINMVAGTSYALLINNADGNSGFGLSWGGTGTFLGPDANIVASDTTICAGESVVFNGSTSTGYTSLNWTFNSTGSPVSVAGAGPHTINFPTTGNYVAILQANATGCSPSTEFKNITVSPGATITATSATICPGTSTVLTASGGTSYTWSPSSSLNSPNGTTVTSTPSVTTTYTIIGVSGSCTASTTAVANVSAVPGITVSSTGSSVCAGNSATLTASGAGNYTWSPSGSLSSATGTVVTATPSVSTNYTVTGVSATCTTSTTHSVTVINSPTTTASASATLSCITNTVNLNSILAGMNYTWTSPAGGGIATGVNSQNATTSLPGTYTLTVLNPAGNCSYSTTATVVQNTIAPGGVDAGTSQTLTCGTSVSVTLSGSVTSPTTATPAWLGPNVCGTVTDFTTSACGAGIYTLQVTDPSNGCPATATVQVFPSAGAPSVTVASTSNTITCTNTIVTISVSTTDTPVTYNWSGTGIASDDGLGTITVTQGGTFNYTVTNTNSNCSTSNNHVIFQNTSAPTSTAVSTGTLTCVTSTVMLSTLPAGMNYTWTAPTGGNVLNVNSQSTTASGIGGTYSLTVKDPVNNCVYNTTTTVIQNTFSPTGVSAGSNQALTCTSPSVTLTGSVSSPTTSTVVWTGPNVCGTSTAYTTSACSAGIYTITATDPSNGCFATSTVQVLANAGAPVATISSSTAILTCTQTTTDATVTVTPPNDLTYSWSPAPLSGGTSNVATFDSQNNYVCTITNTVTGCVTSTQIAVTTNTTPPNVLFISNTQTLTCAKPTATISVATTPASGITYLWTGTLVSGQGTDSVIVNQAGTYSVMVTNAANGCTNTASSQVAPNTTTLVATISATSSNTVLTCQNTSVNLLATVTPTNATYNYTWSPSGGNLPPANVTSAGVYTVVAADPSTGCTTSQTIAITSNTTIPSVNVNNSTMACGAPATVIGGSAITTATNVSYSWSTSGTGTISGGTTSSPSVNASGAYVVTVTNSDNDCANTGTVIVTEGSISVAFGANPTSGTAPLDVTFNNQSSGVNSYAWNFGDVINNTSSSANPDHTYNSVGMYTVTLIATNGNCKDTAYAYIEVLENSLLIVPNVFTPNGDGANDLFKIVTVGIKDLSCDIFNRWGAKVHSLSNVNDTWNGGGNSAGTYFYTLKCTGFDGKEYNEQGTISLFK
ncbi:MAG: hypothetical protein K0S26_2 [Bacteroidota bacterium]|jgi:gliding motility-associated-like protein|nr:hypothetical protein [Bacteroidota bacterium]